MSAVPAALLSSSLSRLVQVTAGPRRTSVPEYFPRNTASMVGRHAVTRGRRRSSLSSMRATRGAHTLHPLFRSLPQSASRCMLDVQPCLVARAGKSWHSSPENAPERLLGGEYELAPRRRLAVNKAILPDSPLRSPQERVVASGQCAVRRLSMPNSPITPTMQLHF